ncbi:hypothetical protein HDU98_010157 [Podochytrium sp. JEL0797]|nr:hypothetical protein HDU98_010157 [Podochytrium sp. JEL0797]
MVEVGVDLEALLEDPWYIYTALKRSSKEKVGMSYLLKQLAIAPLSSDILEGDRSCPRYAFLTVAEAVVSRLGDVERGIEFVFDFEPAVQNPRLWWKLAHTIVSGRSCVSERSASGRVLLALLARCGMDRRKFYGFVVRELGGMWLYDAVMASLQVAFSIKLVRWRTRVERGVLKEKMWLLVAAAGLMSVFGEVVDLRKCGKEIKQLWIAGVSKGIRECFKIAIGVGEGSSLVPDMISEACMNLMACLPVLVRASDVDGMGRVDWETVEDVASVFPCWKTRDAASFLMRKLEVVARKAGRNANRVAASWQSGCLRQQMHPCMMSRIE